MTAHWTRYSVEWRQARDEVIWQHAAGTAGVILTKDEDFSNMTLVRSEPVAVVWLRVGNCRTGALLATMERAWPDIMVQLEAGARLIEVR